MKLEKATGIVQFVEMLHSRKEIQLKIIQIYNFEYLSTNLIISLPAYNYFTSYFIYKLDMEKKKTKL